MRMTEKEGTIVEEWKDGGGGGGVQERGGG